MLGLAACGGGGSEDNPAAPDPVTTVEISPATLSLEPGQVGQVSAVAKDAEGDVNLVETITFASSNAAIQVAANGLVCAGTWDSLTNPVVCSPSSLPNPIPAAGVTSNITATAAGITSTATVVYVHRHVDSIVVSTAAFDCKSHDETQQYTATALAGGVDVTASVGPFSWSTTDALVALVNSEGLATARGPGRAGIIAVAGGATSLPATFTTCMPEVIVISGLPDFTTSFSLAVATTKQLAFTVIDTHGNTNPLARLRYNTNSGGVATVNESGLITALNPGVAIITASCIPPSCGAGINQPTYSNAVVVTVTGGGVNTTVYVGSTTSTTLIPVTVANGNVAGNAITLPHIPNSAMFEPGSTRLYLGSDSALMVLNPADNSVATFTSVAGRVLAISPNGLRVLTSAPGANAVFLLNAENNTAESIPIPNASAAAFSADSFKAYILSGTTLYVWSQTLSLKAIDYGTALNDVDFHATGQFGYITSSLLGMRHTCRNDITATFDDTVAVGNANSLVRAIPNGTGAVVTTAMGIAEVPATASGACPPTINVGGVTTDDFGVAYTPRGLFVRRDSAQAMVVGTDRLFAYDIATNTATPVPLPAGVTALYPGGFLPGINWFYLGMTAGGTHSLYVVAADTGNMAQQLPMSFVPDIVAVRPK